HKALQAGGGNATVSVSAAPFVPKPHTVFEREPQISIDEGFARIDFLKSRLKGRKFKFKWNDPRQSYLEGVFSRGDRQLAAVIEEAWRQGARLDAWSDFYRLDRWRAAAATCQIDFDRYLRRRTPEEILPWQHLDAGIDQAFLDEEYAKAMAGDYTPDCRVHGCQKCGLCDFKTVKPIVHRQREPGETAPAPAPAVRPAASGEGHFVYRIDYSRLDEARFLGHLELIQMFYRVLRRVRMQLNFSQGFNPTPKVIFSPALPVGTESLAEYLCVDLVEPLADPAAMVEELNRQLPRGFAVLRLELSGKSLSDGRIESCYQVALARPDLAEAVNRFLAGASFVLSLSRKGKERQIEARPLVREFSCREDGTVRLVMESAPSEAGVKPLELLGAVFGLSDGEMRTTRIVKLWVREAESAS
ncbi:MAG: TIGR03936 family radical SAM-associated protein, partial [Desulfobulbaceae bacterium]|nr:TIGR03936 family radical SAM-associated protein [Desulfobulbaceae bacterium]